MSVTLASAAGSLFARVVRGPHGRRSLHDRGLRRLPGRLRRGHLHGQGPLRGGRLRGRATGAGPGERAPVARPVRGAVRARGARLRPGAGRRLSLDRPRPRSPPAALGARRLADPALAAALGARARGMDAEHAARDLALQDPRQPAAQPGRAQPARRCWPRPGRSCPAGPRPGPLRCSRSWGRPRWSSCCAGCAGRARTRRSAASCAGRGRRRARPLARAALDVALLAYRAWEMLHAIVLTLVRLLITQRRLLEWETAAAASARAAGLIGGRGGLRVFAVEMAASPLTARPAGPAGGAVASRRRCPPRRPSSCCGCWRPRWRSS